MCSAKAAWPAVEKALPVRFARFRGEKRIISHSYPSSTILLSFRAPQGKRFRVSAGCLFGHDPTGGTTRPDGFWPARQEAPTLNRARPLPWTGQLRSSTSL